MSVPDHGTSRNKSLCPSLHKLPQGSSSNPSRLLSPTLGYASLCGKIDSIAHLKFEANELSDKQCELLVFCSCADYLQDMAATHSEGEQFCATVMMRRKCKWSSEDQVEEDGYELLDSNTDVMGECESSGGGKRQWMDPLRRRTTSTQLDKILASTEEQCQENRQNRQEILAAQTQTHDIQCELCDIQRHAVDIQEHTSVVLLDILYQSLLSPTV